MRFEMAHNARQLRSLVNADGTLELSLSVVEVPEPAPNEVIVRVEAAPINPSDLGLLLAGADNETVDLSGPTDSPIVRAVIPAAAMRGLGARVGQSLAVGNEGAGTVIDAGSSDAAQALVGKTVALAGGSMYTQYRCVDASICLVLPEGTSARDGASSFVNPLTALGMVETMRREGHSALVHTAAASNLGQMLIRLCATDEVRLVNIVRRPEQAEMLRALGGTYVWRFVVAEFHGRPDKRSGCHLRHDRLRRGWRRKAGRSDPRVHGGCGDENRHRVQPIWIDDP
jgi:NADPH:quinone reductase